MSVIRKRIVLGAGCAALITVLAFSNSVPACSTFLLRSAGGPVFGRNVDSDVPAPGMMVVNKRGISKRALSWGTYGPGARHRKTAAWTSRFGSVTATAIGREFPDGGMNEAGLVIEEMTLEGTKLPNTGRRPSIAHMQWIQYQLDTKSRVKDVLADLNRFDITGWDWHFMVGDSLGDCAAIEFIDGKPVVHRSSFRDGCVLTNDRFSASAAHLRAFVGFGGNKALPQDRSSLSRFVTASARLNAYSPGRTQDRISYAFATLAAIDQGRMTFRSFVHDIAGRRIYFRTLPNASIRFVDLQRLDFSPKTRVLTLDLSAPGKGDVTAAMKPYTRTQNRAIVAAFYGLVRHEGGQPVVEAELKRAGMSEARFLDRIAAYPETL